MKKFLKRLFCRHKSNKVVCWHWTHGWSAHQIRFLEIQLRCRNCGKYHFIHIKDPKKYDKFVSEYADKEWSDTCKPVL